MAHWSVFHSSRNLNPRDPEPSVIFIGGLTPKTRIIDPKPRRCPLCGLNQAHYRRVDHYLSFFFIPVLRVKKGEPFLSCGRCQQEVGEMVQARDFARDLPAAACARCGRGLQEDFRYCPGCGNPRNPT